MDDGGGGVWPNTELSASTHCALRADSRVVSGTRLLSEMVVMSDRQWKGQPELVVGLILEPAGSGLIGGPIGLVEEGDRPVDVGARLFGQGEA